MWGYFMGKDNFYKNSLVLTLSNSTTGILKFVFSIILSKELGAEGLGLYSLIMPIYDLFCCLVCGGLTAAISKETSVFWYKKEYKNLTKTVRTTLIFDFFWSLIIAIIVFFIAPFFSSIIIKDSRTLFSIRVICPALIFVALSSIIKGFFYGISKVNIPAYIDISEKAIRIAVVVGIINLFSLTQIEKTVSVVYIALTLGELVSFLLLYTFYKLVKGNFHNKPEKVENSPQLLFNVLFVSVPLCINGFLSSILYTASALIVPRRLVSIGIEHSTALALIGKFSGMALSIIFFPLIVVSSISIVLIPDISQNVSKKDSYALQKRITDVIKISFLLGISTLVICFSIPDSLGQLFYNRLDLGLFIKIAALSSPFTYVSVTTFSILNGLGKQGILLRNSLIISVEEVILLYILTGIPSINILGYGISLIITSLTAVILNIYEIYKHIYISFSLLSFVKDVLVSVLLYYLIIILNNILPNSNFILKNIFLISLGFTFFIFTIILISKEESVI